jgi:hypothetical protein
MRRCLADPGFARQPKHISSQLLRIGPRLLDKHPRDRPKGVEFRGQIADT